eukprot:TRINITY_DN5602_c0_g1_i1.p1 TRINITY_DN5602_c0_g1~~TRINITY_DN5602_c0_g1_i1.p1  ORF type:complete len:159 (-),score=37.09 TRINITY_DN5602_c0_g1_i1:161-637(-)
MVLVFFFFSSRRRHTRSCLVSWARRCVQETDIESLRRMIKRIKDCKIDSAYNGEQCLQKILEKTAERKGCLACSKPYRLIFMDFDMPVMDGPTAARKIKELVDINAVPSMIVIGCTAFPFENEKEKCLLSNMQDYLSKPVMFVSLQEMFKKYFQTLFL